MSVRNMMYRLDIYDTMRMYDMDCRMYRVWAMAAYMAETGMVYPSDMSRLTFEDLATNFAKD